MNTNSILHIHFIGIGGVGMCGIAEFLHVKGGYIISGSDIYKNDRIQYLESLGIKIFIGHNINNIIDVDIVIRSTAILNNNLEIQEAYKRSIPILHRSELLAQLIKNKYGIAISGTHGKTITTSLISSILLEDQCDPNFIIGGKLNSNGSCIHVGKSKYFVVEADESDASFLSLNPVIVSVTNIDNDHLWNYSNSFDKLCCTFIKFIHTLPDTGLSILCIEDTGIKKIIKQINRPIKTYGFCDNSDYRAISYTQNKLISKCTIVRPSPNVPLNIVSMIPGKYNILNILSSVAIATELKISDKSIVNGLFKFRGVDRRFQILGTCNFKFGKAIVISDYGHHPTEIINTINTIRTIWPNKKLMHVFQPHRYSRTQSCLNKFIESLCLSDELILLDIYSAGEKPIAGLNIKILAKKIKKKCNRNIYVAHEYILMKYLDEIIFGKYIILMQGAGNIGSIAINIVKNRKIINNYD